MKFGILGGGFGLYGYLPAAMAKNFEVYTLSKYQPIIQNRTELAPYLKDISFIELEEELCSLVSLIAIARDAESQSQFIASNSGKFEHIYLEKPVGVNAENHEICFRHLAMTKQPYSVGYLFPFMTWYSDLLNLKGKNDYNLIVVWRIKPIRGSWKSKSFKDSGLFSYYAVHFVPLLHCFDLGIKDLDLRLEANFLGITGTSHNQPKLDIRILYDSKPGFEVKVQFGSNELVLFENDNPFGRKFENGEPDFRVSLLHRHLDSGPINFDTGLNVAYEKLAIQIRTSLQI